MRRKSRNSPTCIAALHCYSRASNRVETVEEYLRHAARSDELAAQADSPAHKAQIAKIAQMWRDLAKQRQRQLQGREPQK